MFSYSLKIFFLINFLKYSMTAIIIIVLDLLQYYANGHQNHPIMITMNKYYEFNLKMLFYVLILFFYMIYLGPI